MPSVVCYCTITISFRADANKNKLTAVSDLLQQVSRAVSRASNP